MPNSWTLESHDDVEFSGLDDRRGVGECRRLNMACVVPMTWFHQHPGAYFIREGDWVTCRGCTHRVNLVAFCRDLDEGYERLRHPVRQS